MARVRVIRKTKRLHRTKYHHVGTLSDGLPKQEKPFTSSSGMNYIGTPEWQVEPLRPFQQACQVKAANQPPIEAEQAPIKVEQAHRKPVTDYVSLAMKVAKALNGKTSLDHVDKVAEGLFIFDVDPHLQSKMPDMVSQEIFNWIITLSEQPIDEEEKLRLARKFIVSLAPVSSPVEKLEKSYAG